MMGADEGGGPGPSNPEQAAPLSRHDEAAAGRQLTNAILANLVAELRQMGGDELVEQVRRRAGERRSVGEMTYLLGWSTLAQAVALLQAAVEVTGDPDVPFRAGQWSFRVVANAEFVDALRALSGPGELLRLIGPIAARVTTVTDAEAVEVGDRHAVVRYVTRPPYTRDPIMCTYTRGTLSSFSEVFGLAYAEVTELACQTRGDSHCVYRVTWDPESTNATDAEARIAVLEERIEALSVRFENLQSVSALLSSTHDITAVLDAIVHLAGVAVSALHHVLAVRLPGERSPRVHAVGMSAAQADVLAAELLSADHDVPPSWSGTMLAVEVVSSRRRYGKLAAFARGAFLPNDRRLLTAYAGHAAAALDAAVAFDETRMLLDYSAQLTEIASTNEMTSRIAQAALRVSAAGRASVFLWQEADALLVRTASASWLPSTDATSTHAPGVPDSAAPSPPAPSPTTARPAAAMDAGALQSWALGAHGTARPVGDDPLLAPLLRAAEFPDGVAVPLAAQGELLGVLVVEVDEQRSQLTDDITRRLAGVATLSAPALHSARLLDTVQHQANHDPLTGLPNARLFGDRLSTAMASCRRSAASLAVLFVDLDGFKDVNDRLGHAAGDRVLCEVAERLRRCVREADSVARLGGDEFVVLMPGVAGVEDAEVARARIARALEASPVRVGGDLVRLDASIGIACFPDDGSSPGDLVHQADVAMYRSKLSRRAQRT